jgi:purine-nucleoside phosphorylase
VRVIKYLGVSCLLLTNASGGMNPAFQVGDLMVISDHINLMPNPLIGKHFVEFGARFPDMGAAYDKQLCDLTFTIAAEKEIKIHKGVYVGVTGPTYETDAEYKFFRIIGGDAVGMSTVPEVIVARQMGLRCFALSVITDMGIPGQTAQLTHEMVQQVAAEAEPKVFNLLSALIERI